MRELLKLCRFALIVLGVVGFFLYAIILRYPGA
jgi:hypothetical protein